MPNGSSSERFWRKSSHSGEHGDCVEVAFLREAVIIRDSQNPSGPRVVFSGERWQAFLSALVRAGEREGGTA
ncbi:DUF397 domain-containing protein [Streptomyces longisporoflavus]|uniref:DUF397 domain-containing protein n=1 Tax=Streptomyces longisporoflavus TaxID=28044 RepID=A0ABW7QRR6_9ACTN